LLKHAKDFFQMGHRSNYDWMLFPTSPMAFKPMTLCSQRKCSNPYRPWLLPI